MTDNLEIKTFDTRTFRDRFLEKSPEVYQFFKPDFESFFCLKLEDLTGHAKLPIPPSREKSHSILFISQGFYEHKIGFSTYNALPGTLLIVPASQVFAIEQIDEHVKGFTCHFHPSFIINHLGNIDFLNRFNYLKIWGNHKIDLEPQTTSFIEKLLSRLHFEYTRSGLKNKALLQAYLYALLLEIHQIDKNEEDHLRSASAMITQQFIELLNNQEIKERSVKVYADHLHISPNHLNKSVKLITGKTTTAWINESILLQAKSLLYQTSLSIGEIAYQVGIEDTSYFSRIFKKHEGLTPRSYRKKLEKS